jgi:outer membrane receptor protein involved in Fe transport
VSSGNPVPLAPPWMGGLRAVATHDSGLRAGLRSWGWAPRPLPHGARGAPLLTLDATAGYRWQWLSLDVEFENLLDQRFREGEYHYASDWRAGDVPGVVPGVAPSVVPVLHSVAGPPLNARLTLTVTL